MPSKSAKSIFDETFKQITGESFDQVFHSPLPEESLKNIRKGVRSKYPLFPVGVGEERVYISEEQRENHMLVSGATQEGKSKLLLHFIHHDIDRLKADEHLPNKDRESFGLCFLDPTPDGATAYKILDYCAKINYKKILLIDPYHRWTKNKVVGMNLFEEYRDTSVVKIMDTIRVLFDDDPTLTRRVNKFFPALLRTLWATKLTLHEAENFQSMKDQPYASLRNRILEGLLTHELYKDPIHRRDYLTLTSVFGSTWQFEKLESTTNRLQPFLDSTLDLMFGARERVNWDDIVADGWVVLVNLDDEAGLEPVHTKLLATAVINEINSAIKRLRKKDWDKRFYLYLDEAGEYVTPKIARILDLKQKTGLTFILAHQRFSHFDKEVLNSVLGNTKIRFAFWLGDADDRHRIVRQFYGGELLDRDVEYVLSGQKKQHAVVKLGKDSPKLIKIPFVKDSPRAPKEFINEIYSTPWYLNVGDVLYDQQQRLRVLEYEPRSETLREHRNETRRKTSKDNIRPQPPTPANDSANSKSGLREPGRTHKGWERVSQQSERSDGDAEKNDSPKTPKASKKRKPKRD